MLRRLLLPILILPFNVLVVVPALLLYLFGGPRGAHWEAPLASPLFWLAAVSCAAGLALCVWTVALFVRIGLGTPAPWDAPRRLVVRGPYRHVRNPMISGIGLVLLAETLFFQSWALLAWLLLFVVANLGYIPLVEEKQLERRFGEAYRTYKANVPRWLPRRSAWRQR